MLEDVGRCRSRCQLPKERLDKANHRRQCKDSGWQHALPEYVFYDNGKWAPYDPNAKREPLKDWVVQSLKVKRARIDIELVVDGNIVDLNRIPLPADTPIIDKRFKDKHDK